MNTTAIGCDTDGWRFPPSQQSPPPACTVHCAHTADGIVELSVAGLLAAREALYLRHAIVQYLRTERAERAFVIDLRKALVLLEGDCVAWPTIDDAEARVSMKPIAVVVAPEVETRFLLWTWEMASAGLARAAFVDRDEALGWVCSRARGLVER
jgi:hypothetical protein